MTSQTVCSLPKLGSTAGKWLYKPDFTHQRVPMPDKLRGITFGTWYVVVIDPAKYGLPRLVYTHLAARVFGV